MDTRAPYRGSTLPASLRRSVSAATWLETVGVFVSLVAGAVFFSVLGLPLLLAGLCSWIVGVGPLLLSWTLRLAAWMGGLDRQRIDYFSATTIPAPPLPAGAGETARQRRRAWVTSRPARRQAAYQVVRVVPAAAAAFLAVAWWWTVIAFLLLGLHLAVSVQVLAWQVTADSDVVVSLLLVLLGLGGFVAWPAIVGGCTLFDTRMAQLLLGASESGALAAEVERLSGARTLAVESAQAERRRIERDLHDGLQPKLVALALDLGLAKTRLERDPEGARDLLERAHQEAKSTIEDLRGLVRGIHPAVLDDRGLDAALSALVASCSVPVRVEVTLHRRPERAVEAVAYFVVAEAITNITKHAGARQAWVTIEDDIESLRVVIADDGRGGATLEPDGGLAGLVARVEAIDGTLRVSSPPGGPTRIESLLPCGR